MIVHILFVTGVLCNWTQLNDPRPPHASQSEILTPHQYCQDHGMGTAIAVYNSAEACDKASGAMEQDVYRISRTPFPGPSPTIWPGWEGSSYCIEENAPVSFGLSPRDIPAERDREHWCVWHSGSCPPDREEPQ